MKQFEGMLQTNIIFRREEREGVVAVGTYLLDAAKRLGIRFEDECRQDENVHFCSVVISNGAENMSPLTSFETEHFAAHERRTDERLACQTKIENVGDLIIMTTEKNEKTADEPTAEEKTGQYKKEFTELPLEKKLASLVELEGIALGETVSFIINSPYLVFGKVMDIMAEFGLKKEEESKKAARPKEHEATSEEKKSEAGAGPKKKTAKTEPKPKENK